MHLVWFKISPHLIHTTRDDQSHFVYANSLIKVFISRYFSLFQTEEDVGDVFQDQQNMAAILMRKHLESGDLLMVS